MTLFVALDEPSVIFPDCAVPPMRIVPVVKPDPIVIVEVAAPANRKFPVPTSIVTPVVPVFEPIVIDLLVASCPIEIAPVPVVTVNTPLVLAIDTPPVPAVTAIPPAAFDAPMVMALEDASVDEIAVARTELILIPPPSALREIAFAEVDPVAVSAIPPETDVRAREVSEVPKSTVNSIVSEVPPSVVKLIAPGALSVLVNEIAPASVISIAPVTARVPPMVVLPVTVALPVTVKLPLSIVTFPDWTSRTVPAPPVIVTVEKVDPPPAPVALHVAVPPLKEVRK
jgi:hypothetical protein